MPETTTIQDLVNPQVMADMISAKITSKIVVTPFAKVDTTLQGVPGDTITVPQYSYIGDAVDVAEGVKADTVKLQTSTTTVKIKKAMKAVELTDESVLSGYGNPVAETNNQIGKSIAAKVDADAMAALQGAQLRKDSDFLSADKYKNGVMLTGEIGMVANCRVVPSKKVPLHSEWYYFDESGTAATEVNIAEIRKTLPAAKVGDKVTKSTTACYFCPIVKLNQDSETEDDTAALTIYLKRDTNVEVDRETLARKTDISADRFYAVALSDTSKVVLAKFKK